MTQPHASTADLFVRTVVHSWKVSLRLSVLLSRTAHAQFHAGQIRLAVKRT
jgi:hypothetical protein